MNAFRVAALVLLTSAPAIAQSPCSHETVSIKGSAVTVTFCVNSVAPGTGGVTNVAVEATYEAKQRSMAQRSTLRFIVGEGPSRALESVNLESIGIDGTLHMTLVYSGNQVSMEHALLTPGAITVK